MSNPIIRTFKVLDISVPVINLIKNGKISNFLCMFCAFGIAKIVEGDYLEEFEDRCNNQRDPENNRCSLLGGLCSLKVACNKLFAAMRIGKTNQVNIFVA